MVFSVCLFLFMLSFCFEKKTRKCVLYFVQWETTNGSSMAVWRSGMARRVSMLVAVGGSFRTDKRIAEMGQPYIQWDATCGVRGHIGLCPS